MPQKAFCYNVDLCKTDTVKTWEQLDKQFLCYQLLKLKVYDVYNLFLRKY